MGKLDPVFCELDSSIFLTLSLIFLIHEGGEQLLYAAVNSVDNVCVVDA